MQSLKSPVQKGVIRHSVVSARGKQTEGRRCLSRRSGEGPRRLMTAGKRSQEAPSDLLIGWASWRGEF